MSRKVYVAKVAGDKDEYDPEKLKISLKKSGASIEVVDDIVRRMEEVLYEGIPTSLIYQKAHALLKSKSKLSASKYGLKKSVLELGPTGYPFEHLVARLLAYEGFEVKVGEIVKGHCVSHEVDVVARKEKVNYLVECKYHSEFSRFSNVKIPLYIHSRFEDIDRYRRQMLDNEEVYRLGWIYTNTRFSEDAITYGKCMGLKLISWKYPEGGSLEDRIRMNGLYPVTCLNHLTVGEKQALLKKNIVTAREIKLKPDILKVIGIESEIRRNKILKEIESLCDGL